MPQAIRCPSRGAFALAIISLAIIVAGCGGDGGGKKPVTATPGATTATAVPTITASALTGDEGAVEAAVRQFFADYNAKDVDGVLAVLTDRFLQEKLGLARADAAETLKDSVGEPSQELRSIENIKVTGESATAEVTFRQESVLLFEQEALVRQNGIWRFDDFLPLDTPIPDGMKTIDLKLVEYEFDFDKDAISNDEALAFKVSNTGQQEHELELDRVPADLDLEPWLQTQELPEGVEVDYVAYAGPLAPGEETTVVFANALPPGRYVMLSFSLDTEGTADVDNGMIYEFTIE